MSNQYYELYLADVLKLTKSLVLKSDAVADAINKHIQMLNINYVLPENKLLWKYYQNLQGDYFYLDVEKLRDYNYKNGLKVNIRKVVKLTALDVVNQYFDLGDFAYADGFIFKDSTDYVLVKDVDFQYEFSGGADGKTRVIFINDYSLSGSKAFMPNDEVFFNYNANNGKMIVRSIDTLEDIEFTKENLLIESISDDRLIHRATYRSYKPGSSYFDELVRRYPDQEVLIRGILNPVVIQDAIDAPDHQILFYDKELVEENEITLISNIQNWINKYYIRWNVYAYSLIDELYAPAHLGIMWLQLPMVILNLRLAACKTHEVHSYHIRQYLASHNKLDNYFDYMTKKQQLFFYRNIRYIQRNSGKIKTFDTLTGKVLTDRTIPLNAWNLSHNVKQIGEKVHPDDSESDDIHFVAQSEMLFESINGLDSDLYKKTNSVLDILLKQTLIAKDNFENIPAANVNTQWDFNNSQYSELKTKTLESTMIDYTEAQPYKFSDIVLNHWLFLAYNQAPDERARYRAIITIKHPNTGDELNLNSLDAFILFLYAFNQSTGNGFEGEFFSLTATDITNKYIDLANSVDESSIVVKVKGLVKTEDADYSIDYSGGIGGVTRITFSDDLFIGADPELEETTPVFINYHFNGGLIPNIKACRVRRIELPTISQLMKVVDASVIDTAYAVETLNDQPEIDVYASIESFHELCTSIYRKVLKHRELHALVEDKDNRAYIEQMVDLCYHDVDVNLGNGKTFDEWFTEKELSFSNMSRNEWLDLAMDILNTATGVVFNRDKSLRRIQEAMIGIMSKLSSYSVHYLKQMIDNLIIIDWTAIRFSENNNNYLAKDGKFIHIEDLDFTYEAKGLSEEYIDMALPGDDIDVFLKEKEMLYMKDVKGHYFGIKADASRTITGLNIPVDLIETGMYVFGNGVAKGAYILSYTATSGLVKTITLNFPVTGSGMILINTSSHQTGIGLSSTTDIEDNIVGYIPMANFLNVTITPYVPSGRWIGLPSP